MQAIIKTKERIKSSTNGNPRFFVIIETIDGETLHGKTALNACFCYENWKEGQTCEVKYHFTKKARNLVFDSISSVND